jgi:TPR repeat protein
MNCFDWKSLFLWARRPFPIYFLLFLTVAFVPASLCAQENANSETAPCVPSGLAQLIVPDGHIVRVNPVREQAGNETGTAETVATVGATPSTSGGRAAREAYKIFEKEARQGRPAAMVNLAVSFLAGWGAQPNGGAAVYWLQEAANRAYAPAFYNLGILYFKGCGVRQDYAEALRFFDQGSRGGDAASEVNLGYMYDRGLGVIQDHAIAASWYRKAAERGDPQAQYNLADLYLHAEGVPHDEAAAFAWFQKAALQGHTRARIMLGSMYALGRGTPKDVQSAYLWISAAALQGDARGSVTLLSLEPQLTPAQLAEARLRARSLALSSAPSPGVALLH